jgi:hypothetical protein
VEHLQLALTTTPSAIRQRISAPTTSKFKQMQRLLVLATHLLDGAINLETQSPRVQHLQ